MGLTSWISDTCITLGDHTIRLTLLNSAWSSTLREKAGQLPFPHHLLKEHLSTPPTSPTLSISAFHHPYGWFSPNTARQIRTTLDQHSDLILTGHEHESSFYSRHDSTGENIEYIEGGVLQDSDDASHSSFNVVIVDTDQETQRSCHFNWNDADHFYTKSGHDNSRPFQRNKRRTRSEFPFSRQFHEFLQDPGVALIHPRKKQLLLDDIFLYPDLREVPVDGGDAPEVTGLIRSRLVYSRILSHGHVLLIGGDSSGKTSLAKKLTADLRRDGHVPLYLSGPQLSYARDTWLEGFLANQFLAQYEGLHPDKYWQLDPSTRAIVLDDYHRIPLAPHARSLLLASLARHTSTLIVLAGDQIRFEEIGPDSGQGLSLSELKHLEIMELGMALRSHLVHKWHRIGWENTYGETPTQSAIADVEQEISTFLGEQYIPAYPLFVLIVLQSLEFRKSRGNHQGSIGYLYELLILKLLQDSSHSEADVDTNKNYLAELAFEMARQHAVRLPRSSVTSWHARYCSEYRLNLDENEQLIRLLRANVLTEYSGMVAFKYNYLYYYFVALRLANTIHTEETKDKIQVLATYLHQEDVSHIMLFLCHLTRDPFVIRCIVDTATSLFASRKPAALEEKLAFLDNTAFEVLEERTLTGHDASARRMALLVNADDEASDAALQVFAKGFIELPEDSACEIAALNEQLQMTSALKTIQIIGQILRNHSGSLKGEIKAEMVRVCLQLGLRTMGCLFGEMQTHIEDMVATLVRAAKQRSGGMPRQKVFQTVRRSLWGTLRLGTFSLVKYMSDSLGSGRLAQTFEEVWRADGGLAARMIDVSIKLDYFDGFPEPEIARLANELQRENNQFVFAILRDLVYLRMYLYKVDYRVSQSVCEKLRIGISSQRKLNDPERRRLPPK